MAPAPRPSAGDLPAGPSPQGAAISVSLAIYSQTAISDDYLSDRMCEVYFIEIAQYKLIVGFVVHLFFSPFSLLLPPLPSLQFPKPPLPLFCKGQKQLSVTGNQIALQKSHHLYEPLERVTLSRVPKSAKLDLIPETFLAISCSISSVIPIECASLATPPLTSAWRTASPIF